MIRLICMNSRRPIHSRNFATCAARITAVNRICHKPDLIACAHR